MKILNTIITTLVLISSGKALALEELIDQQPILPLSKKCKTIHCDINYYYKNTSRRYFAEEHINIKSNSYRKAAMLGIKYLNKYIVDQENQEIGIINNKDNAVINPIEITESKLISSYKKKINNTSNRYKRALLLIKLGDIYKEDREYKKASEYYYKSLKFIFWYFAALDMAKNTNSINYSDSYEDLKALSLKR